MSERLRRALSDNGPVGGDRRASARFDIGAGYAVYEGPIGVGTAHRHAAFQIAIGNGQDVTVVDGCGTEYRAPALVIAPMVEHCLQPADHVRTYFVEPHCTLADELRRRYGQRVACAPELRTMLTEDVAGLCMSLSSELDPRLGEALSVLADHSVPLRAIAARVGLSVQRLRALARRDLDMPLTRWRVWARLRRATLAVRDGQSLAEAAVTAGFADQAHLTRQMREMMGLTPAAVLPILRA